MKLYVVWGSQDLEQRMRHATLTDDSETLNRISQAISQASEFWRSWAFAIGGEIVSLDGSKGMAKVPADKLDELEVVRGKYAGRVGVLVSVGVAMKPSEAQRSCEAAMLENAKIRLYTPEVDKILEDAKRKPSDSVDKLAEEYIKHEVGYYVRGEEFLHKDLRAILPIEVNLKKTESDFYSPMGIVGIKPTTAYEEYVHNIPLQRVFPGRLDKTVFMKSLDEVDFYGAVSSAHWMRIKKYALGDLAKSAFAWRWSKESLDHAAQETIDNDQYVQRFLINHATIIPLEKAGFEQTGPEILTAGSPQGPAAPSLAAGAGNAGMAGAKRPAAPAKPKGEASEHSQGEAARAHAAEDPKVETTHAAKDFQDQLTEMSESSEDEDGAGAQQIEDTESGDQIRQQVMQVLTQFRQFAPYMEQIKQENPDLYNAFMQVVQTMLNMARELIADAEGGADNPAEGIREPEDETEDETKPEASGIEEKSASGETNSETKTETKKEELEMGKAALPMPHAAAHHHVNLPVGSYKEGDGHIKVQHGDGKVGWVEARAGQVMSQDGHAISALNPGGR